MASLAWVIDITQELWQYPPDWGRRQEHFTGWSQKWNAKFKWRHRGGTGLVGERERASAPGEESGKAEGTEASELGRHLAELFIKLESKKILMMAILIPTLI